MSKRKGVSLEEKRQRILHIYHESKDVFNIKEIEKLASKAGVGVFTSVVSRSWPHARGATLDSMLMKAGL